MVLNVYGTDYFASKKDENKGERKNKSKIYKQMKSAWELQRQFDEVNSRDAERQEPN